MEELNIEEQLETEGVKPNVSTEALKQDSESLSEIDLKELQDAFLSFKKNYLEKNPQATMDDIKKAYLASHGTHSDEPEMHPDEKKKKVPKEPEDNSNVNGLEQKVDSQKKEILTLSEANQRLEAKVEKMLNKGIKLTRQPEELSKKTGSTRVYHTEPDGSIFSWE